MANASGGKKSAGGKKPSSGNNRYKTTSGGKRPSSSRGGAKKIALNPRSIVILAIVVLVVIALLVVSYKLGWIDLTKINDSFTQQSNGSSSTDKGGTSGGSVSGLAGTDIDGAALSVHFIDIGQGDAISIKLPDGKFFLIDAGSGSGAYPSTATKNKYSSYLTDTLSIGEIDYLMITHPDADHVNMASKILDDFVVKNIYFNNYYTNGTQTYKTFTDKARSEEGATVNEITTATTFTIQNAGYRIDIYAPGNSGFTGAESKTNSMSIMCVLSYGGRKVMFTGDGEVETEEWFMGTVGESELDVDVLKVGHHGSHSCTSTAFVEFIKPEYAVISCGEGNKYKHPHQETMTTLNTYGVATYRTDQNGNIVLYLDDDGDFGFTLQKEGAAQNNSQNRDGRVISLAPAA